MQDLEKNFYDKLTLDVNEVQVAFMPSSVDWRDYLENCSITNNYKHHLLYPVSTNNLVFISINPNYKKLPKLKLEANVSSIRLSFSDQKIIKLAEFAQKFPKPEIPKNYHSNVQTVTSVNNPTINTNQNNMSKKTSLKINPVVDHGDETTKSQPEPDHEWDGPFSLPKYINGDPIPNYCQLLFKFSIKDFGIDLNDECVPVSDYLKLILNKINIDFAITKFGMHFRADLGDLKLIDKIHKIDVHDQSSFTEILSSSSKGNNQIIKFYFRQVEPEAPNFDELYKRILMNVLFDCSNIYLVCHRTAIIYFIKVV